MKFYRHLAPIKALSFDLDDTLYDNKPIIAGAEQALINWLIERNLQFARLSKQGWRELRQQAENIVGRQRGVSVIRHTQLMLAGKLLGLPAQEATKHAEQGLAFFLTKRSDFQVPSASIAVLAALKAKYRLIAITNGNVDCQRLGLDRFFEHTLLAGEDGPPKPAPDLFWQACHRLKLAPRSVLHVGDQLDTDISGAKLAGLQACWLNSAGLLIRNLSSGAILPDLEINQLDELLQL